MGTFTREDLAKHGKTAAETQEEEVAEDEAADESIDEATEARLDAELAERRGITKRESDEETLRFPELPPEEPMPDMSDEDIAFDNDKYREKMRKWVRDQGRIEARRLLREEQQVKVHQSIEAKIAAFEKTHPDFAEKVRKNQTLASHQLHPAAGEIVARSKYTAELLYRFGKDPALAIRTAQESPIRQGIIIDRMIGEIEAEKAKSTPKRPTITRKGPASREEALSGKQSMSDFARESREKMQRRSPKYYK